MTALVVTRKSHRTVAAARGKKSLARHMLLHQGMCEETVTILRWPLSPARCSLRAVEFFSSSPRSKTTEGGEPMMIATLLIGTVSLVAMVTGFVVMIRD
jgi:hypothetical protein